MRPPSGLQHMMEETISLKSVEHHPRPSPEQQADLTESMADGDLSSMDTMILNVKGYVKDYMSRYDASHDYKHILRVLALAQLILSEESKIDHRVLYDPTIVTLAALLHDVGDAKYIESGVHLTTAEKVLLQCGATQDLALAVQTIVENVSYSTETKHPEKIHAALQRHPELAIVQDADRLDAIGAIGIGRAFTYACVKRGEGGLDGTIKHFTEKLENVEKMMKTDTGRKMATARTKRLRVFRGWWEEEAAIAIVD